MQLSASLSSSFQADNHQTVHKILTEQCQDPSTYLFPQKNLPNVRKFKVSVTQGYHPILMKKNIRKREYPPLIDSEQHSNKSINRYLHHQFLRLNKSRNNSRLFWRIAETLLNRSSGFSVLLLHEVFPGWHRKHPYGKIWKMMTAFRKINLLHYKFREKAIPKASGGHRYLGIAPDHWRLYLHGLQLILHVWLSPYRHPSQHGFMKGKGTDTAWLQVHTDLLNSGNIYEFDLKKFFDSVNLDYLREILSCFGLPTPLLNHIIRWNRTFGENTTSSRHHWSDIRSEINDYHYHITKIYVDLDDEDLSYWYSHKRHAELRRPWLRRYDYYHGVAQGNSLSPLLSTLLLTKDLLLTPDSKIVQYADDGILYDFTRAPLEILTFPAQSGIEINIEKSHWVRRHGVWQRPLVFLGKKFDGRSRNGVKYQGGVLSNNTRSPHPFIFSEYNLILQAASYDAATTPVKEKIKELKPSETADFLTFDDWFLTKYYGFISSRIYAGNLNLEDIQQDFSYHFVRWSWADLDRERRRVTRLYGPPTEEDSIDLTVFNSSSFACRSLSQRILRQLAAKPILNFQA